MIPPSLRSILPTSWFNQNAAAEELAERYVEGTIEGKISDLAGHRPRFVFCATDMQFRTQWVFDTGRQVVGHDVAGYAAPSDRWTIAEAAAASSCFPTVFSPVRVDDRLVGGSYGGPDAERLLADVELSDGGIYDNLGLEPVWRDHAVVLVSDAAPSLSVDPQLGALWHGLRYIVTLLEQATDVRKRWLISSFARGDLAGTYWGIAGDPGAYGYDGPGRPYSHELIRDVISQVRIDFDVFSDGERGVLENHGYLMAEVAVGRHAKDLVAPDAPPPAPPHPDWMDDAEVRSALATSSRTRILGRRFARARRRRR